MKVFNVVLRGRKKRCKIFRMKGLLGNTGELGQITALKRLPRNSVILKF